jgi:hypothetical protein
MLCWDDADRLLTDEIAPGYVCPDYDEYCFANVPSTVGSLLDVDIGRSTLPDDVCETNSTDVDTVVVVLVDGFGFEQWDRHHVDHDFFERLTDRTTVTPLTSVYPSETAAAMGTYMTARMPVEHGLIGWNVYLNEHDTVIESLPFQTKDEEDAGEALGADRDTLRKGTPITEQLAANDVETWRVVPESIIENDAADVPHTPVPYDAFDTFADGLRDTVQAADSGFIHAYLPQIDTAAHENGTEAEEYSETLGEISTALEQSLVDGINDKTAERTLLIVTADHGHVDTDPEQNIDLREFDTVREAVGTDAYGTPLLGGGPRNVHLYLDGDDPERVRDDLATELEEDCDADALVLTREDALGEGLFGPGDPSETFVRQCGDVLVIPRDRSMWHGKERDSLEYVGMHGGLHSDEQLVPFAAVELDVLRE